MLTGAMGLSSTLPSAKILHPPVQFVLLPGPRRSTSVARDFAVKEVGFNSYRSRDRENAFGIADIISLRADLVSVACAASAPPLEPPEDVYTK